MLLILTIVLVIAAAVLLIVGFVQHSLPLLYGCVACSVAAAVILIMAARLGRRRALRLAPAVAAAARPGAGGGGGADDEDPPAAPAGARAEASGYPEATDAPEATDPIAAPEADDPAAVTARNPVVDPGPDAPPGGDLDDEDYLFPIDDYDALEVNEILPLLAHLEPDELEDVRAWELEGPARASVVRRIDSLLALAGIEPPEDRG